MSSYKINYEEKEYILSEENCIDLLNDDERPVSKFDLKEAIELLNKTEKDAEFDTEYYQEACPDCLYGVKEKQKFFAFLEYHFYIFTKNGEYGISDISNEYSGKSFNKLSRGNEVDDSYIVSVIVCKNCCKFVVQVENCIV